jgi:hypothetical protein
LQDNFSGGLLMEDDVTVVGVKLYSMAENPSYRDAAYVSDVVLSKIRQGVYRQYSKITSTFLSQETLSEPWSYFNQVVPSTKVPKGSVYVGEEYLYSCPKGKCAKQKFKVTASNLYYTETLNLKVKGTYNKKTIKKHISLRSYPLYLSYIPKQI